MSERKLWQDRRKQVPNPIDRIPDFESALAELGSGRNRSDWLVSLACWSNELNAMRLVVGITKEAP